TELSELGRAVPGLSVRDVGSRDDASIILRGLSVDPLRASTLGDNGSVATYINETPVTNQPKIFDIERVEVLRGPQGTLYGSGSLGGAIRYIVADPKMKFEASVGGKVYQISAADDVSYEVNGMINMPLVEDKLAVRVAAQYLDDSGFTDYPFVLTGPKTDLDFEQRTTARASLLWTPTENFEATLSYYTDNSKSGGRTGGNPGFALLPPADGSGDGYSHSYPAYNYAANSGKVLGDYDIGLRFEEPYSMHYQLTALEMKYDLGFADLISSTSYTKKTGLGHRDQTDLLLGLGFGYESYPDFRSFTTEVDDFEAAVQELRLVSSDGGSFDYEDATVYEKDVNGDPILSTGYTIEGGKVELNPQFRAGVAYNGDWTSIALDVDLVENDPVAFENATQYASLGVELDVFSFLQLRAGYRTNMSASDANVASVGLGLSPFGVHLDIAAMANPSKPEKEAGVAMELGFYF
ncbi:MAG: hypothetical protein B7Z26_07315, partial [Asticcacaulis sp. 32-58-5]